jgi:hypothetical protein
LPDSASGGTEAAVLEHLDSVSSKKADVSAFWLTIIEAFQHQRKA